MKNKIKQAGCHNCGSNNTYTTMNEVVCRKCGYRRDKVLEIIDKIKEKSK